MDAADVAETTAKGSGPHSLFLLGFLTFSDSGLQPRLSSLCSSILRFLRPRDPAVDRPENTGT